MATISRGRPLSNMKSNDFISISCAADHNYACGLFVTLKSIVDHTKSRLKINVLDTGLTAADREELKSLLPDEDIHFFTLDTSIFQGLPSWRGNHATYARLLLQDYLKEDWTIYTDIDTLWLRDIADLWAEREEGKFICAVADGSGNSAFTSGPENARLFAAAGRPEPLNPADYFCAGLVMLNLKALRTMNFTRAAMDFLKNYPQLLAFPDQNLYNWFFAGKKCKLVDQRWNEFSTMYGRFGVDAPRMIHYANQAPWRRKVTAVGNLWWEYLANRVGFKCLNEAAAKFQADYEKRARKWKLLSNKIVFNLVYGPLRIFNPKTYRKRHHEIFPA